MSTPVAGWYPDPTDPNRTRWWDGSAWTEQTQQRPAPQSLSLLPPPSGAPADATPGVKTKKLPRWAWAVIGVVILFIGVLLSPIFTVLWLVVLITAIVALIKNTPTWLRFRDRRIATIVTAISAVCFLITGSVANALIGDSSRTPQSAPVMTTAAEPEPTAAVSAADGDADVEPAPFLGYSSTVSDTSSTDGLTAFQVLESLPVKGRAAKTGYDRAQFGPRWSDVDRNGCDTRNDILARDLRDVERSGACKVITGELTDPYTNAVSDFVREQGTSELVQIDHVVALSDAWQKGAQQLTVDQRATLANDPLNLLAVGGAANAQKGDGDAATWQPGNKDFRCQYVARQVAVKATYGLWVTQAEHDAIAHVLTACPDEPASTSSFAAVAPAPVVTTPAPVEPEPEPAQPAPAPAQPAPAPAQPAPVPLVQTPPKDVYYANCTAVRAAGAAPIRAGDPGYSRKLDRDGDGIGCE